MATSIWHAYYFESFDNSRPPARTETIYADTEDDAGRIATLAMGRCLRVDVTRPVWEPPSPVAAANQRLRERTA